MALRQTAFLTPPAPPHMLQKLFHHVDWSKWATDDDDDDDDDE